MTTSAAENTAGRAGDKEKVEKRRALGRGLESLLPGPRVVAGTAARPAVPAAVPATNSAAPHVSASHISAAAAPPAAAPTAHIPAAHPMPASEVPFDGTIRAVVDESVEVAAPHIPSLPANSGSAELRSAGQPGAAVPTLDPSAPDSFPASSDETITISAQAESRMPANLVVNLAIADIDKNPFQTRYVDDDDALEELADSIKANGVVQPILVRPSEEEGRYILIIGERRLHASKKAGKTQIPAMVRRVSLQQAAEMTIVENLQREDLSALEQAEAFRVLSREFSMTQAQIGERVGLSRTSIANYMRLLKLPREVMQLLAEKKLTFSEAKELLALNSDDQISKAALYAVKKGLTIEQIERLVLSMNGDLAPFPGMPGAVVKKSGARWVDPNVRAAQTDLEQMLGVRVRIRDRKGKGKIVIEYSNVDDYERVVEMLRGKK
jgi:ParB family transcriptional regulator, chromosome partitioning protein